MEIMKSGVLVSATQRSGLLTGYKNIGDYVQSLAQTVFIDHDEELIYVDKERLSEFECPDGKASVVMNAWFMVFPQFWPPSKDINPLFISTHISSMNADKMLSDEGVSYLKKYGPVGCRDLGTLQILEQKDIPCYFSGCLTLSLGRKYKTKITNDKVIFVDPYIESVRNKEGKISIRTISGNLVRGILNIRKLMKLSSKFKHFYCVAGKLLPLKKFLALSAFYSTYSSKFDDEVIMHADYFTHSIKVGEGTSYDTEDKKMKLTESLIQEYADASLVVTSRIHCALPCLGLETPCLFVHTDGTGHVRDPGRFGGLLELFNIINYRGSRLYSDDDCIPEKIRKNNINSIRNNDRYIALEKDMAHKCAEFFGNK